MGIGESGFYPSAPKASFPWTALLSWWLFGVVVWLVGSYLLFRFGQTGDPIASAGFGAMFALLTVLCVLIVVISSIICACMWIVRKGR